MDWLARTASARPDAPAVTAGDATLTYGELHRAADGVATILLSSGIGGEAVAFWGTPDPLAAAVVWGVPRAGFVAMPVDAALPPAESMRLTREAGARALWTPPRGGIERLIQSAGQSDGDGPPAPAARYLLLTSGSAGGRKGVLLNGANIGSSVAGSTDRLGSGPDDVWLCSLPLFHVAGLAILWRAARDGSHVVLMPFDADAVAAALHRVTLASLVPTMLRRALAADPGPYRGLRAVLIGGGPADEGLLRTARDAGIPALRTYGMTETCSQLATVALDDAQPGPTSGRPIANAEVRIVDDRGRVLAAGRTGLIEVRGPMVFGGYLGGEARQDDTWFATGDVGALGGDGRLTVLGRADAMIVTGGENVQPAAVEAALWDQPGVVDARVFGEADADWGEAVVAEVVIDPSVTLDHLRSSVRSRLARHEVPKEIRVVGSIHRGPMGKTAR